MTVFSYIRYIKLTIVLFLMSTTLVSTGCGTLATMFGEYKEEISSILITQDEKIMVAVGRRHHYIFDAPKEIIETLKSPYVGYVYMGFVNFEIKSNGSFTGTYKLNLNTRFNEKEAYWADAMRKAKELCYEPDGFDYYICSGEISGTRYNAGKVKIPEYAINIKRQHTILVRKTDSFINNIPTPITVTGTTMLYFASMPLVVPGMGLATYLN